MNRRQRRRLLITALIWLLTASTLSLLHLRTPALDMTQARATDTLFFFPRQVSPEVSQHVVLVAIDNKSVAELRSYGRVFGWPRSLHAVVLKNLAEARARTVVFDVLFDVPAEDDAELAAAIDDAVSRATFVVQPSVGDLLTRTRTAADQWQGYGEVIEPRSVFTDVSSGVGMVDQDPDPDGTVRRVPMVFNVRGEPYPSLALLAVARFLRRPSAWDGQIQPDHIPLAGREIPIDGRGNLLVNFAGGPHQSAPPAFPVVSFVDVLRGQIAPETFRGKLVLIGITGAGFADDYWTPTSVRGKMPGVEVHANAIDTILRGDFIRDAPDWLTVALIFALSLVAALALLGLPMLAAALGSLLAVAVYMLGASYYFDAHVVLNLIYPPLALGLTYTGVVFYRVIFEQGQSRALRAVLGQYLSPSVVEHVTRDPDSLKLGGDEREMTVMFSDLRGFTTFSESLDPETLVHLLNEYLTIMSDVIFKYDGTIDKYMGDAIMAFWGAPQHQPDHAALACRAALEMVAALDDLNARWVAQGRVPLVMGIGINTGTMKVGNMGSSSRFDYTVLGDAVNLASRLEGLNKEYGTTLIVSKASLDGTGGVFHDRFLDLVAVKGKKEPVAVYEILDAERLPGIHSGPALRAYDEGIELYRERDWLGAAAKFQEALRLSPDDGPSAVYLQRCEELLHDPPPIDWDGVYVMTRK
ncbi:MAG: adenylate/guanylate cyclase domain-containing protein [Chloroflexi bacterium]|nr:adenylate/guanylate cyclase domain-containing protein [Chloroflexota bacterium]